MPRGGPRPNAGRKSNAQIARIRDLIDTVMSDEDWKKVFANLLDIAITNKGYPAVQAAGLLCRYRFGVPADRSGDESLELLGPIEFIQVDPTPAVRNDAPAGVPEPDSAPEESIDQAEHPSHLTSHASRLTPHSSSLTPGSSPGNVPVRGPSPGLPFPSRPAPRVEQPRPLYRGPGRRPGR